MPIQQILALIVGIAVLVGIPVMLLLGLRDLFGKKASERPSHTSSAAAFLGALAHRPLLAPSSAYLAVPREHPLLGKPAVTPLTPKGFHTVAQGCER